MGGRKKNKKKTEKIPPMQVVEKLEIEELQIEQQVVDPVTVSIFSIVIKSIIGATATFFTGLFWKWWVKDKKCDCKKEECQK